MPSIRTRFTYLWLIIVACCIVTKPVVAAPVTAQVVIVPCKINGEIVNKQILLIGVLHRDGENDMQCFEKLSTIINKFIKEHKGKELTSVPVLLEASGYQTYHKHASSVEFKLATTYVNAEATHPFDFIQADERDENDRGFASSLKRYFDDRAGRFNYLKTCKSGEDYKDLCAGAIERLLLNLKNINTLGLQVEDKRNEPSQQSDPLSRIDILHNYLRHQRGGNLRVGSGSFALLYADLYAFKNIIYRNILESSGAEETETMASILQRLPSKDHMRTQREYAYEVQYLLLCQFTNASLFSQLVEKLIRYDKVILFCGAAHCYEESQPPPDIGLLPLFRDFGCTVKEIESHQASTNQDYISPSRLQEIFTNFLSCCNTCGKTEACLKDNEKMKPCPCHAVTYCSQACQKTDWKNKHKTRCKRNKKETKPIKKTKPLSFCHMCSSTEKKLSWCSRCHAVAYCSRDCQVKDWKTHKEYCKKETT